MPGHAPYLMPDGQPLSKYLTLEKDSPEKKSKKKSQKRRPRGKDEIWEHLKKQQVLKSEHLTLSDSDADVTVSCIEFWLQ